VDGIVTEKAHTYSYITADYAVGGIWEWRQEFDNEQQRWVVTLPLTETTIADGVNQLFFFHPGDRYMSGDDRHASPYGEVLLHKDAVIQLWALPEDASDVYPSLIGCLPKGEWRFHGKSGYGRIGNLYTAFHLMNDFIIEEKADRISVASAVVSAALGVIVEAISSSEALAKGIETVDDFAAAMQVNGIIWLTSADTSLPGRLTLCMRHIETIN
jgi:hypothetical protein